VTVTPATPPAKEQTNNQTDRYAAKSLAATAGWASTTLSPAQVTNGSVMVSLPATLPIGAYAVTAGGSMPILVNAPDLWWAQGAKEIGSYAM